MVGIWADHSFGVPLAGPFRATTVVGIWVYHFSGVLLQPGATQWQLVLTLAFGGGYTDDEPVSANEAPTLAVTMATGGGYTGSGSGATLTDVGILSVDAKQTSM